MRESCRSCIHFRNDPAYLESVFQGLNVMSSAWASVVAEDGVCLRHDRYLSADSCCGDYKPVALATAGSAR